MWFSRPFFMISMSHEYVDVSWFLITNGFRELWKVTGDKGSSCHTVFQCNSKRLELPLLINAASYFYWTIHRFKHTERKSFSESFVQFVAKSIRTCGIARWKRLNSVLFWIKVIFHLSLTQFRLPKNGCIPCGNWFSIVWV